MQRLLGLLAFVALHAAWPAQAAVPPIVAGRVDFVAGDVRFVDGSQQVRRPAKGAVLRAGDTVVTGGDGEVHLDMEDGGYLAVRPGTRLKVVDYLAEGGKNDRSILDLVAGTFRSITGWIPRVAPKGYRVNMVTATLGVRGTDHEPLVIPEGSELGEAGAYDKVNEGATFIEAPSGRVEVPANAVGFAPQKAGDLARLLPSVPDFFHPTGNEKLLEGRHRAVQERLQERLDTRRRSIERTRPDHAPGGEQAGESGASATGAADAAAAPKVPLPAAAGAAAGAVAVPLSVPGVAGSSVPAAAPAPAAADTARRDARRASTPPAGAARSDDSDGPPPAESRRPAAAPAADEDRATRLKRLREAQRDDHRRQYERERDLARERDAEARSDAERAAAGRRY
jgi:hypothetical protein